jgi:hypothetical protein
VHEGSGASRAEGECRDRGGATSSWKRVGIKMGPRPRACICGASAEVVCIKECDVDVVEPMVER